MIFQCWRTDCKRPAFKLAPRPGSAPYGSDSVQYCASERVHTVGKTGGCVCSSSPVTGVECAIRRALGLALPPVSKRNREPVVRRGNARYEQGRTSVQITTSAARGIACGSPNRLARSLSRHLSDGLTDHGFRRPE